MSKKIMIAALLIAAVVLPAVLDLGFLMTVLVQMVLYMYWASAWNIMGGYAGLFSLGNGLYVGVGAYVTGMLYVSYGVTPWIGMLAGGVVAGILGIIVGYPSFKIKPLYYALATFALLLVMKVIFTNTKTIFGIPMGGSDGFKIARKNSFINMQFADNLAYYYIALALLVIILLVSYYISTTRTGYYFRAIHANEDAAASLGVNVLALKTKAQFISALFTGVGGGVFTMLFRFIDPHSVFGVDMSINIMIMAVVGGANTLWGPLIGAGLLRIMNQVFVTTLGAKLVGIPTVVFGVMLMLVIYFIPGGILGYLHELKDKRAVSKRKNALADSENGGKAS